MESMARDIPIYQVLPCLVIWHGMNFVIAIPEWPFFPENPLQMFLLPSITIYILHFSGLQNTHASMHNLRICHLGEWMAISLSEVTSHININLSIVLRELLACSGL